jgi:DNA polymerase-1
MSSKFLIVDGNSLSCRAAFAHNPNWGPDLHTSNGRKTGATYRFINMFDSLLRKVRPTHIIVGWDVSSETFRKSLDENYKANRKQYDKDLYEQFKDIKSILEAIGIHNVGIRGYEADDVLGTYAEKSKAHKTFIASGDKDIFQLVDGSTTVLYPKSGFSKMKLVTPEYIINEYDIDPRKFIDLKMLMGDNSDNIPGIKGCGPKTAKKLLNYYKNAEEVADNAETIDEIKGVTKTAKKGAIEWKKDFEKIKKLVTIRKDVDVPYDFEECRVNYDWDNAKNIFEKLEFKKHLNKLKKGGFYGQR